MKKASHLIALLPVASMTLGLAQPVTKTGECAPFTRYNTPPGEDWGQFPIQPNPLSEFRAGTVQNPLTPQQSANCIDVPAGLKAELWASEAQAVDITPGIAYLQHFTFDERGRMWAVEPRSYPNIIRPASGNIEDAKFQGGLDRILILEDTDGDRVMDKVKVFKDGLNLPQGIEVVNGGVVVAMVPYLVFFPDNGDVAGTPVILFSGMGTNGNFDTKGGINSLMYGLDNWIYGHTGYNSCIASGSSLSGSVVCGQGRVWRFRHSALGHSSIQFQAWTTGPSNAHGIGQMEDGQIFQSGANGTSHINHSIRQHVGSVDIRSNASGTFYPITGDRWLTEGSTTKNAEGWFVSRSTAVSSLQIYTSRLLPRRFWNRFAFACEGASKLCNQDSLVESGSTWSAVRMPGPMRSNLLASKDAWVSPILAKTGPDGAVWVLDWYNYLLLHGPNLPKGSGDAWENHLRDKTRYRIWRVTPEDGSREPVLDLSKSPVPELVAALDNPNFHWRLQAQRLLIAKGYDNVLGTLLENILATDRSVDGLGNSPRVLHALWTLHGLDQFTAQPAKWGPILEELLRHPAWAVRRNTLMAMPRTTASAASIGARCAVNNPHAHVRLQALVALSETANKPSGLPAMSEAFRNTDKHSQVAFDSAGIASAASGTCTPALHPTAIAAPRRMAQVRSHLRITALRDGIRLDPHGQSPDGELILRDLRGRIVFRSRYSAREARWIRPSAVGLDAQTYVYAFRAADGGSIYGRLALAGRL